MRRGGWILWLAGTGVVGLLLLIAADRFDRPFLIGPGLLLFAFGTFAAGVDAFVRRHTYERNQETLATQVFTGASARAIGFALIIGACALAIVGISFVLGLQQQLYGHALERPGRVLVPAGLIVAAFGVARLLGAREWRGSVTRLIASIPERMGGGVMLLVGMALIAIGAWETLAPGDFDGVLQRLGIPW